jgi:hypothetical protein
VLASFIHLFLQNFNTLLSSVSGGFLSGVNHDSTDPARSPLTPGQLVS